MMPTNADFEPLLMAILESPESLNLQQDKTYRSIHVMMTATRNGCKFSYYCYLDSDRSFQVDGCPAELLKAMADHDPEAKKKARLAELKKEIEQLEGQDNGTERIGALKPKTVNTQSNSGTEAARADSL